MPTCLGCLGLSPRFLPSARHCLVICEKSLSITQKWLIFVGQKSGYILGELCDLSGNHHNLKLFLSLTPKTFQAGPKK